MSDAVTCGVTWGDLSCTRVLGHDGIHYSRHVSWVDQQDWVQSKEDR